MKAIVKLETKYELYIRSYDNPYVFDSCKTYDEIVSELKNIGVNLNKYELIMLKNSIDNN